MHAEVFVNAILESETASQSNDSLQQVFDLDPTFSTLAQETSDQITTVLGNFDEDPVGIVRETFSSCVLPDDWTFTSSYTGGRARVVADEVPLDGHALVLDSTSLDPNGPEVQVDARLFYEPVDGRMWIETTTAGITAFQLESRSGIFTGTRPAALSGIRDVFRPDNLTS